MELNGLDDELLLGDADDPVVPAPLLTTAPVMDMSFHPTLPLLAVGLVSGEVEIFEYEGSEIVKKPLENHFAEWVFGRKSLYSAADEVVVDYNSGNLRLHPSGSAAALEFTDDGSYLVSVSSDRTVSVVDCATARLVIHITADTVRSQTTAKKKRLHERNTKFISSTTVSAASPQGSSAHDTAQVENAALNARLATATTAGVTKAAKKSTTNTQRDTAMTTARVGGSKKAKKAKATVNPHRYGISALNICDDNLIATGDDDGLIAIWDMRARRPAHTYHEHGDYVTQLCYFVDAQELVSSSGDTCLGVYDMRGARVRDVSDRRTDELNCFAFINSSGTNRNSFIPTIICGTPSGSLPMWKYGSWSRPYDALDHHPRECEALIFFHAEDTAFNHNIVLTGAVDGLVRVIQMYPLRRNLCQLSARDNSYAHGSAQGISTLNGMAPRGMGRHNSGGYLVKRQRGQEAIARMRVSHDGNMLAVSGNDNIIDFVDIRFLNNEKELDALRGKAERRHLSVIRDMERDAAEEEAREKRMQEEEDSSDDSDDDSDSSDEKEEKATSTKKDDEKPPMDSMEAYMMSRAQKRERVAATKWLKEERRKKINFTFEKRRRRVGGFFGDMVAANHAADAENNNK